MGIVLRRSTTLWTWLSAFKESAPFDVDFHGSFDCRRFLEKPLPVPRGPPEALDFLELLKAKDSSKKV